MKITSLLFVFILGCATPKASYYSMEISKHTKPLVSWEWTDISDQDDLIISRLDVFPNGKRVVTDIYHIKPSSGNEGSKTK